MDGIETQAPELGCRGLKGLRAEGVEMITALFLIFVAAFAVAGVFISLAAKKRKDGTRERSGASGDAPKIGRAPGLD